MKILPDENIPVKAKTDFAPGFEVFTVRALGWNGRKNGDLMRAMLQEGFSIFITLDKNLRYQQNLKKYPVNIFLLQAPNNKHQTLQPFIEKVKQLLSTQAYSDFNEISL